MKTLNSFRLVLATALIGLAVGCGSKSTIDLQQPPAPPTPEAPKSNKPLPGDPANPNDPGANPEKPDQPVQTGPVVSRYRLLCDRQSSISPIGFLDSTTKSFEGSYIFFLGSYTDPNGVVTREHQNLHVAVNAVTIPGAAGDAVDFLFLGQKDSHGGYGPTRFYQVHADTLMRTGNAVDIGAAPDVSKSVRLEADRLGLIPANYGASDLGNFLLLPGAGGFRVTSKDRKKTYGTIPASTSTTILPKIFEDKKVFTALTYNGRGFSVFVKKLTFAGDHVSVAQSLSAAGSGSATPAQNYDRSSLIWSETSNSNGGAKSLTLAKVDLSTNRVTRTTYTTQVANAKVYPQFAVINQNEKRTINLAVESLTNVPRKEDSTVTTVKVNYAAIELVTLDQNSLTSAGSLEYPALAIARVEAQGLREGQTIIKTLFTTENQDELFGTFDAINGYQLFKDRGGYLDGISQNNCRHPQAVEEIL